MMTNLRLKAMRLQGWSSLRAPASLLVALLPFTLFVLPSSWGPCVVAMQAFLILPLVARLDSLFLLSVFWLLFGISLLVLPWPLPYIAPLGAYFAVSKSPLATLLPLSWLRRGDFNRRTVALMIATALGSTVALTIWTMTTHPDLSVLARLIPHGRWLLLGLVAVAFSLFNATWEEFLIKGVLWLTLEKCGMPMAIVNIVQAVMFGLLHFAGFPSGVMGVCLATVYGLLLGFIRRSSNGLAAPIVTHFFADLTIFGLVALEY